MVDPREEGEGDIAGVGLAILLIFLEEVAGAAGVAVAGGRVFGNIPFMV